MKNASNASNLLGINTSRRLFLKASTTAVGGFSLGVGLTACSSMQNRLEADGQWQVDAWLEIAPDNSIIFTLDRVEMGQGTYTGLTTLLAEELEVTPESVKVVFAGVAKPYRNRVYGMQITGGSNSLSSSWGPIRETGAIAREMLMTAASDALQLPQSELIASGGHIVHAASDRKLSYGSLARLASKQVIPSAPRLKQPSEFKYIGKQNQRIDNSIKVTGQAGYGIDVDIEGMRYAVVKRSPYIGASLKSYNADKALAMPGVEQVLSIETGVAVVAKTYWQARKALAQLSVEWQRDPSAPKTTEDVFTLYRQAADDDAGDSKRSEGDIDSAFEDAASTLEVEFEAPFLAHATMEPMNCTAHVRDGKADIWTSTQGPDIARVTVAKVTNVDLEDVTVHNQFIGGGFGRRLNQDFVGEAAEISYKAGGVIKLVWSREDDTQNDFFRPASYHRLKASFDADGQVTGWNHQIVAPKILEWYIWDAAPAMFPWAPKFMYSALAKSGLMTEGTPLTPADHSPYEGADTLPYNVPAIEVRHTRADAGVPVTFWRSVGHSQNAFVVESFVDELAEKAGQDPYQYRRDMLPANSRLRAVLDEAAQRGRWNRQTEEGVYQGIAAHKSFGSYVAQVVELKIEGSEIKVQRVTCVVDCGLVVNPDIVTMQMESGVIFGITAALFGDITIEDSQIKQTNFHDYRLLRMDETPLIETYIMPSAESPTGVGEPGLPPIAPAMANALFKATGKRHRQLPLSLT